MTAADEIMEQEANEAKEAPLPAEAPKIEARTQTDAANAYAQPARRQIFFEANQSVGSVQADAIKAMERDNPHFAKTEPTAAGGGTSKTNDQPKAEEKAEVKAETKPEAEKKAEATGKANAEQKLEPEAEIKLKPMRGVNLSSLPGYEEDFVPDDTGSIKRIAEKYANDPEKLANAILHHQRASSTRDRELGELRRTVKDIQQNLTEGRYRNGREETFERDDDEERDDEPRQRRAGRPTGSLNKVDFISEAKVLSEKLKAEEIDMAEYTVKMAELSQRALDTRVKEIESMRKRDDEARTRAEEETQREVLDTHNARIYWDRAKEILREAAAREGREVMAKRYGDPHYQLTREEYEAAKPRLMEEFNYIADKFNLPDGAFTLNLFRDAARFIDPQDYEQQIRLDERRKTLAMIQKGKPSTATLNPGAGTVSKEPKAVTSPAATTPPAGMSQWEAQRWFLSQPQEVRDRLLKEQRLPRH